MTLDHGISWKNPKDGWVAIEDPELIAVLRNTHSTPWNTSPYTQGIIGPSWIMEAVSKYKEAGGYAGMSLFEWLDRMAGEHKEEPKHSF